MFDVFIDLHVKQIKEKMKHDNRRLYPATDIDAYEELSKQLQKEYAEIVQVAPIGIPNFMARESLLLAMQFLTQYTQDKYNFVLTQAKQANSPASHTTININAPVDQFIANVEQMNTTKD